jgi:hypothetical protein
MKSFRATHLTTTASSAEVSEKMRFASIAEEDVHKGMRRSKFTEDEEFEILQMWAQLEKDYPVHHIMARQAYSVCETEAQDERVFSFMKSILGDLRHSMDGLLKC